MYDTGQEQGVFLKKKKRFGLKRLSEWGKRGRSEKWERECKSTQPCFLRPVINKHKHWVAMARARTWRAWHNLSGMKRNQASWMTSIQSPYWDRQSFHFFSQLLWPPPRQTTLCLNLFLVMLWSRPGTLGECWKCSVIMIQPKLGPVGGFFLQSPIAALNKLPGWYGCELEWMNVDAKILCITCVVLAVRTRPPSGT